MIYRIQSGEIQVASIHHIEACGLWDQFVQNVDVVQLAIADMDECRNIAAYIFRCDLPPLRALFLTLWRPIICQRAEKQFREGLLIHQGDSAVKVRRIISF